MAEFVKAVGMARSGTGPALTAFFVHITGALRKPPETTLSCASFAVLP